MATNLYDIAKENGFDKEDFISIIKNESGIKVRQSALYGLVMDDWKVAEAIDFYKKRKENRKNLDQKTANILVSSGFTFEGYKIVKYSGYISGDDTVQIDRSILCSDKVNGQLVTDALVKIRAQALRELKDAAYSLGCNAVIGVDFDYMTFDPMEPIGNRQVYYPYVVCVTANGNAVVIEKE